MDDNAKEQMYKYGFEVLSAVLGALLFYAIYLPWYALTQPGISFQHFAFVLVVSALANVFANILGVILVFCIKQKISFINAVKKYSIGDFQNFVTFMLVEVINAVIFTIGVMSIIRLQLTGGSIAIALLQWCAVWVFVKVGIRLIGRMVAIFLQSHAMLFGLVMVAFAMVFMASIYVMYQTVP
jgi:hypothetical protein